MRKKTSLILLVITLILMTGCNQEAGIGNASRFINSLTATDKREQTLKEDEPEVIEQHIEVDEDYWQNGVYSYYYNQLTPEKKNIYNQLYETVLNMKESTTLYLGSLKQEEVSIIYRVLRYEHPEIYWIEGYSYAQDGNNLYFYPTYLINTDEKSLYDNMLENWTEKVLESVDSNMTDFEKELVIYDYLVTTTEYNLEAPYNQSLISIVKGESVCLGYTKALKSLCDKISIPCVVVEGTSREGVAHSWNKIQIEGNWYNVDATNSNTAQIFSNSYDMFNITDELIKLRYTETILGSTSGEEGIEFEYPIANSIEADYYKMKGLYIKDLEEIEGVVSNHLEDGTITIRFSPECNMKEELQEYIKHMEFKDSDGKTLNIKCLNYINIEYIRLLEINWS